MELDVLKHFVGKDVELLVGGVWVEGHMQPIVKGVITLIPFADQLPFYGPTALKAEVVQAVRQVNQKMAAQIPAAQQQPTEVRSSLDQVLPSMRFVHK